MTLTGWGYAEVGWLLEEVKSAGGTIPSRYYQESDTLDPKKTARMARLDFGLAISSAFSWRRDHRNLTSDAQAKSRVRKLSELRGRVERVQCTLNGDDLLRWRLANAMGWGRGKIGLDELAEGLDRLGKTARKLEAELSDTAPLSDLGVTAQELLYDRLAKAYRKGLDADPLQHSTTSYHDPRGPFIAFVKAAHQLAGDLPPSSTALETALAVARKRNGSGEE